MIRDLTIAGLNLWAPTARVVLTRGMGPIIWQIPPLAALDRGGRLIHPEGSMHQFSWDLIDRIEAALVADTWLADAKVDLFTNDIDLGPDLLIADFTVADFAGYAQKAITSPAVVFQDTNGNMFIEYPSLAWQPTSALTPNVIRGYFVSGLALGTGIKFLWGEKFDAGVTLAGPQDAVIVLPTLALAQYRPPSV